MPTTWTSHAVPVSATPLTIRQNVGATAVAVSGISQFLIDSCKWNYMRITGETQNIRYTLDGTSPTSSHGHVMTKDGAEYVVRGKVRIYEFRMIAVTGTAVVEITLDDWARQGGLV